MKSYFKVRISDLNESILAASTSQNSAALKRNSGGTQVLLEFNNEVPAELLKIGYSATDEDTIVSEVQNGDWSTEFDIVNNSVSRTLEVEGTLSTAGDTVTIDTTGLSTVLVHVTGSWTLNTVYFESSVNGTDWIANFGTDLLLLDGQLYNYTIAGPALLSFNVSGFKFFRAYISIDFDSPATVRLGGTVGTSNIAGILGFVFTKSYMRDGNGGILTSTTVDTKQALDVNIASGVTLDATISGVATSDKQDTGNTSLSSIDTKLSSQATAAKQDTGNTSLSSIDTKLSSQATAAKQDTGNTSLSSIDTKLSSQATAAKQDTGNASLASIDTKTLAAGQAAMAASSPVVIASNQTAIPASQSGTWNIGTVTTLPALPANQSTNLAQIAGTTTSVGNGTVDSGVQRVAIASNNTAFSVNATGPTLTLGTQGSTGFSVQNLKDAGRTHVNYYAVAAAAGSTGTETAISLTKASGTGATSAANSHTPTSGKRFRITSFSVATRGHNTATAQVTTFNLRINTAGAVATNSTPVVLAVRSATPATANAWDRVIIPITDGYEIVGDGTLQFGVTAAATYSTNAPTWDVTITGFEY